MGFIEERFNNAHAIIIEGKKRFYKVNLYDPLERIKNKDLKANLWDKLQDKRKLGAFFQKMRKAKDKQGTNDFSLEWTQKQSFIDAEKAFGELLNSPNTFDLALIDSVILPFIKECESEEIKQDVGALK